MASRQDATRCNNVGSVVSRNSGEWCCGHVAVLGCGIEGERERGRKRGKVKQRVKVVVSVEHRNGNTLDVGVSRGPVDEERRGRLDSSFSPAVSHQS
jgi:hypothetical protein